MKSLIDLEFFPGHTRKAITFTIDDGNVKYDRRLLESVRPYGIKGTFNLYSSNMSYMSHSEYREFYKGYEIGNHCKYHPFIMVSDEKYEIKNEPFNLETADEHFIYPDSRSEGLYFIKKPQGWRSIATEDAYLRFIRESKEELEEIFGKGSVKSYVWPFRGQNAPRVTEYLRKAGYTNSRIGASNGSFDMPTDRFKLYSNASAAMLLNRAREFSNLKDDGRLKLFIFGVHSHDFESAGNWEDLSEFCANYGNRKNEFYYASLSEIFAYEDAKNSVKIESDKICNPTDIDVYIKISGEEKILKANSTIKF